MAIEAALAVLQTHLVAAGAALTDPLLDVDRGLPATAGKQIRYYWSGEVDPAHMGGQRTLNSELVGERFAIAALWPITGLQADLITAIDIEMQALAGQIRTRIDGDSQLGGNVTDLELHYGAPDVVVIANARHIAVEWQLDLAYVETTIAP